MKAKKPRGLTAKILMAMALGLSVGVVFNQLNTLSWVQDYILNGLLYVGGQIFISSLKLMVVPLVFVSLVCGTASLDDISKLGRVGGKTLAIYLATTAIAISLALIVAAIIQPGSGFNLTAEATFQAKEAPPLVETFLDIFPSNPFQALAEAKMLQIIVFAGFFGIALAFSGAHGKRVLNIFNDLNEVIMKMVMLIMHIAPYGVFCLIAKVFAEQGILAILPLGKYFFVVLLVLVVHVVLTYGGLIKYMARLSPMEFLRNFKDVPIFAFSTASSGATLPVTLEAVEHKLGVDNSIASFTIPLGATINMDGTAIMQGVATLFIAQAYGQDLSLMSMLTVVVTATLASVGTAAVPGVGLITLAMVLRQVNLPVEGIGLIIGVDRLLDMARTAVNVTGDAAVTLYVAKSEGYFNQKIFDGDQST
ncbi:MAG: dicarboxylate/amino acid:cation symporter [Bdellovibrionaceae bacterium]|nr:dicarboxylate/amino acid:cation symporter [Pseudobdellovibrionaceae bacterium]